MVRCGRVVPNLEVEPSVSVKFRRSINQYRSRGGRSPKFDARIVSAELEQSGFAA